jgi:hypothetical protein
VVDQHADLVLPALLGADVVVAVARDGAGHFGQPQDRARDQPLQRDDSTKATATAPNSTDGDDARQPRCRSRSSARPDSM